MSGGFHVGDQFTMVGDGNVGKIVGSPDPGSAWGMNGRPASNLVWTEPVVFINYRNMDERAAVDLEAELTRRIGAGAVFRDARMPAGTEFPRELTDKAARCKVMISVIGERWDDTYSLHLLADRSDWVRREIAVALRHGVHVVPVLVGARGRLIATELPADIRRIAGLQAPHLRRGYDTQDVQRLVEDLLRDVPSLAMAAFRPR
jgi:hypothetical protein